MTFEDEGGNTKMTLQQEGHETKESRDSHKHGWTGSFDKLVETLGLEIKP